MKLNIKNVNILIRFGFDELEKYFTEIMEGNKLWKNQLEFDLNHLS